MDPIFVRTARIIGEKGVDFLSTKTVAVFGIGGVGSYAAEALVRAGVGHLIFIDKDAVEDSNLNRQLVALHSTLGQYNHIGPQQGGYHGGKSAPGESCLRCQSHGCVLPSGR